MRALSGDHSPHKTSRERTQVSVLPPAPTQHGSRVKQLRQTSLPSPPTHDRQVPGHRCPHPMLEPASTPPPTPVGE